MLAGAWPPPRQRAAQFSELPSRSDLRGSAAPRGSQESPWPAILSTEVPTTPHPSTWKSERRETSGPASGLELEEVGRGALGAGRELLLPNCVS